jgi:hypothetical protein
VIDVIGEVINDVELEVRESDYHRRGHVFIRHTCVFTDHLGNRFAVDQTNVRRRKSTGVRSFTTSLHGSVEQSSCLCVPSLLVQFGNLSRFVNHACAPNLSSWLDGASHRRWTLWSSRAIRAGEELTIDYGLANTEDHTPSQEHSTHARRPHTVVKRWP